MSSRSSIPEYETENPDPSSQEECMSQELPREIVLGQPVLIDAT
jgi:hypothetical protein